MLHRLGNTRSALSRNHLVHTPDTFVRSQLPGMKRGSAIVHASPELGAKFVQYTAELEAGGSLGDTAVQRFVFVLSGDISIEADKHGHPLATGGYAYLPQGAGHLVVASTEARAIVIEKTYQAIESSPMPLPFFAKESDVEEAAVMGDDDLKMKALLPNSAEFDFAVNVMTYQPGASLSMVEVHVMEHGLVMLEGGGIYKLDQNWYPVSAGDFIWMSSYCPQWFGALGKSPAKYLIYKDWNRGY